jgi:flagellum-specific ATP synthase
MGQMISGAEADVVVVGLIGERSREVSDFLATKLSGPVRDKSVVVAVPADHAPLLRLRAAMRATAIAEYFRAQGLKVLLLIDSLTRVAHAQREIGLSLGEPPTVKGYPPSALGLIPRLVERAAPMRAPAARSPRSTPCLPTATTPTTRSSMPRARSSTGTSSCPAPSPSKASTRDRRRPLAEPRDGRHRRSRSRPCRRRAAPPVVAFERNRDLILMGAYSPGTDPVIDEAIVRRPDILDFLKQAPGEHVGFEDARAVLIEAFGQ